MTRLLACFLALALATPVVAADDGFVSLFPADGPPKGWTVRAWNDLAKPAGPDTEWAVTDGVLRPGKVRGTWLVSDKEYADFALAFEIKLTERGNSGVALRAPMTGDPAFDGMEFQVADLRYNPEAKDSELTAGIYRAIAPTKQVYKPLDWNRVTIELRGTRLKGTVNGELVQDIDLSKYDQPVKRHDNTDAPPVKDRPRKGHIGFQHLSRNNEPVQIRNARIKVFPAEEKPAATGCVSGVPVGKRPGPYSFLVATGPQRGQQTCYICEQADKPTAVVFARTLTPAVGQLVAKLDAAAVGKPDSGYKAWLTQLADTADLDRLAKWAQEQGLKTAPVGTFEDADGPPAYTLSRDADVTVLLFVKQRVVANFAFRPGELTAARAEEVLQRVPELFAK
ncbi:MAG: DUF1080 domain-containing protein [Gemmataceae bacterium]